ncbi:nitroreductase family protein [Paenibacillus sepulcri]|uniref:nitroreductase family protein n=1 Tax=Paenibacillus sepulcri TaxID=359917 RepID=UPI0035EF807E
MKLEKEVVMELLREAGWAPFHSRKEPWRFILFLGEGRRKFAEAVKLTYSEGVCGPIRRMGQEAILPSDAGSSAGRH